MFKARAFMIKKNAKNLKIKEKLQGHCSKGLSNLYTQSISIILRVFDGRSDVTLIHFGSKTK